MSRTLSLHDAHASAGAHFGEWFERELVESHGDPEAEYRAACEGAALFDLSFRDLLRLTGEDRVGFLHGMVTQDVKGLADGSSAYTAFLTAKGGMVADGFILRRADDLLLDLEPGRGPVVKDFLDKHLVSEEVEVADVSSEWVHLAIVGPASAPVLTAKPGIHPFSFGPTNGWAVGGRRWGQPAVDLFVAQSEGAALFQSLRASSPQLRLAGMQAAEWLRVEAGVPRYGVDMEEKTIPLEASLESALHYQKGCYIGQEVVARATYRGHMNRKLAGLLLGEANPSAKTELRVGERKAGWVTSVVASPALKQHVALGYVHRDFLAPGTQLTLIGEDGAPGAAATVAALPFVAQGSP